MPDGRKIVELGEEIQKLSGYDIFFHYIKGLGLSRYIFDKNYLDLATIVNFVTVDPRGNQLYQEENQDKLFAFGYEIVCKLHNYLTAAETLVCHSRTLHTRLCKRRNLFPDYLDRIDKDFKKEPLAGFIQELRNYFLHDKSPDISFNTQFDGQWKTIRKVSIPLKHLNEKKDWGSRSKEYLKSQTEDIDVLELSTAYKLKVTAFQDWFRMRLVEVFKEDLELLDEKRAELQKLYEEP